MESLSRAHLPSDDLVSGFRAQARSRPAAIALSWRGVPVSYGELSAMAAAEEAALAARGLGPGDTVGVRAAKSPRAIALLLACQALRLPCCVPAAGLPPAILDELFRRAGCVQIVEPGERSRATGRPDPGLRPRDSPRPSPRPSDPPHPGDVTFILTTSGSTGVPKLVPLTRGGIAAFVSWAAERFGIGQGTRVLSYAPLNFDLSLLDVWTTLARGGCAVLVPQEQATDGRRLLSLLAEHEVDVVQAVPMLFHLLTRHADGERLAAGHVVITGDTAPAPLLEATAKLFPNATLYNLYGCTETNDSLLHEITAPETPLPLGEPLPGVQCRLVGEDGTEFDGPGVGELHVRTPFQSPGYLGAQDGGPFTADGFFRSGDLVRRHPGGALTLEGRTDHHVKVRGSRVNTAEVERVLSGHPDVVEAAVVALPDPAAGHRLHAVVRHRPGSGLNSLQLRAHCVTLLPRGAVPGTFTIAGDALPRTTTGKIDRRRLA
ncbi:MAG: AMP-binding protein [Nonomuraea sp.]|nr:AMP-binding protein [Nonomuraea sp.]